ncbi:MAG: sugar phosphate isomerase/epimerase [Oscillospiraceae bacterium]|nr:sugar phosphate isomerase/epimerase [Oscillospiraceae bacterium]
MSSPPIGISTASLYPEELEKALQFLAENGIGQTELFFNCMTEIEPEFTRLYRNCTRDYGIRIAATHPFTCPLEPLLFFSGYQRRTQESLELYRKFFDFTAEVGGNIFVFHGAKYQTPCEDQQYFDVFGQLQDLATQSGVIIAQENVCRCKSRSLDFLKDMKAYLGDKALFTLDLKQAIRSEESPFAIIDALGSSIVHLHISDSTAENDCLVPLDGTFDFDGLFRQMEALSYQGVYLVEVYRNSYREASDLVEKVHIFTDRYQLS